MIIIKKMKKSILKLYVNIMIKLEFKTLLSKKDKIFIILII